MRCEATTGYTWTPEATPAMVRALKPDVIFLASGAHPCDAPVPVSALPGRLLLAGAIAMPLVCFLSAWKEPLRQLFFIPVLLLVSAVGLILYLLPP